eukprot:TRINITY_DN10252_c0_g1_i1.p1 TRINITY_DN10252_c0_g1~~TRINITY_DN10252_c0_g1_i1.p1  ORF type:complete len:128 (+),score=27.57 TRINITY_DN10252_c0_g1_i1:382-765(+)
MEREQLCNCISSECKGEARRVASKTDRAKAIQMFSVLREIGLGPSDELWLCSTHSSLVGVTTAIKGMECMLKKPQCTKDARKCTEFKQVAQAMFPKLPDNANGELYLCKAHHELVCFYVESVIDRVK